jgi:hypothetical protein
MTLIEINESRERFNDLRKNGKITLMNFIKHLDTLERIETKLTKN